MWIYGGFSADHIRKTDTGLINFLHSKNFRQYRKTVKKKINTSP